MLESRKIAIPEEIQQSTRKLQSEEAELKKEHQFLQELNNKRKSLEQESEESSDKIARYKSQLLQAKTNKEYQALLHEINMEETKTSAYEEEILDLMEQSDKLLTQIERLDKELELKKKEFAIHEAKLMEELENINKALDEKTEARAQLLIKIDPVVLSRYEHIKSGRNGIGIVGIAGTICKGCNAVLPLQLITEIKEGNRILTCEQCGRILVWEEDIEE